MEALKANNADTDDEGRYLIRHAEVVTFMGEGGEALVHGDTECRIAGEWKKLVPLLSGGMKVMVV
jgi:hypothetical protein